MAVSDYEIRPVEFLSRSTSSESGPKAALIVLNQPIADVELLGRLWEHADYRVCADGGANQLFDLFGVHEDVLRKAYLPSIIHGDLDSLRSDVRNYYEDQGVEVSMDPDQYSTDFGKSIKQVYRARPHVRDIVVLGTIAGRLDQGIGLLSEMHREQHSTKHPRFRFWLFSESSISFILTKGKTTIHVPFSENLLTRNIGILPIYGPASITTHGLEWDVEDWPTSMVGQVSTSNHIVEEKLLIQTDAEVLFTVERNIKVAR